MDLEIIFDEHTLYNDLGEMDEGCKKAMKATRSDFRTRNVGVVTKAITAHYNIKADRVRKDKGKWRNTGEYSGEQEYRSSPIGISTKNFGMTPSMPAPRSADRRYVPGVGAMVHMPSPYSLTFTIKKAAVTLPANDGFFIRKDKPGEAWHRVGAGPDPIEKVKTLSVAAMMQNDAEEDVRKGLEELLDKRMTHNLGRFVG